MSSAHTHKHTSEFWAALEALRLLLGKVSGGRGEGQQTMRWEGIKYLQFGWCNWRKAAAFAKPYVVGIFLIQKHQTKPLLLPWLGYLVAVVALINALCGVRGVYVIRRNYICHTRISHAQKATTAAQWMSIQKRSMCPHTHSHTHTHAIPHTHTKTYIHTPSHTHTHRQCMCPFIGSQEN